MIFFFALFILAIVYLLQRQSLKDGIISVKGNHRVSEKLVEINQPFDLIIYFRNVTKKYIPFVRVAEHLPKGMNLAGKNHQTLKHGLLGQQVSFTSYLAPKKKTEYHVTVSCEKRGRYLLKDLVFSFGDFIGLQQRKTSICPYQEVAVAPKELFNENINQVLGGFLGDVSVKRFMFEDPVLTAGYRQYTAREPMKQISWTQSSKGQGLMVKKFDYTLEPAVSVILDVDGIELGNELLYEKAYSLARTVCQKIENQGIKYDFYTNCSISGGIKEFAYIDEGLGQLHFSQILECLARGGYDKTETSQQLLNRVYEGSSMTIGKVLITPTASTLQNCSGLINKLESEASLVSFIAEEVQL